MHTPSLFVASVAVLSTFASAAEQKPRFYFPRAIKRPQPQFNTTITKPPPQDTQKETPQDVLSSSSTKRSISDIFARLSPPGSAGTTGDLLASLLDPVSPTTSAVMTVVLTQTTTVPMVAATSPASSSSSSSDASTPNAVDPLLSGTAASSGSAPAVIVQPTPQIPAVTPDSASPTTVNVPSPSSATGSGITFLPGGIITGGTTTSSSTPSESSPVTNGVTFTGTGGSTATAAAASASSSPSDSPPAGLLPTLSDVASSLLAPPTPTPKPSPASTSGPAVSPSSPSPAATSSPGTDPLSGVINSLTSALLPTPTPTDTPTPTPTPSDGVSGAAPTGVTTSAVTPTPNPTPTDPPVAAAPTRSTPLGSLLSSIISPIVSPILTPLSSPSSPTTTTASTPGTPAQTPDTTASTSEPTPPPAAATTTSPSGIVGPGTSPSASGTIVPPPQSVNTTATPPPSSPTISATDITGLTTSDTVTSPSSPTATPSRPGVALNGTVSSVASSSSPVFVVTPTTTNPGPQFFPTSIIAQPSSTLAPGETLSSAPTSIPSSMPKAVANPNGTVVQPEDSTLVQIGFDCSLNYEFVLSNSQSSAQIFAWLVPGVAMGLSVNSDEIVVHSLIPLPVAGCVTTVAQTFIPSSMVGTMKVIISVPSSPLYNINNATIAQLMDKINPAVPLIPGGVVGGGSTGTGSGAAAASSTIATANNGLDGSSGQTNQSPKAAGTTAGVVVLAISGTAAYGAAMFLVARRYKRKKTSHRRSSSIVGPEMRYSGSPATLMGAGAFMSGGRSTPGNDRNSRGSGRTGNSARTQQISAPMMAENSLGWN